MILPQEAGPGGEGDTKIELYNLATDVSETQDVAAQHPDLVKRIEKILAEQHTPSALFPLKAVDVARQ